MYNQFSYKLMGDAVMNNLYFSYNYKDLKSNDEYVIEVNCTENNTLIELVKDFIISKIDCDNLKIDF